MKTIKNKFEINKILKFIFFFPLFIYYIHDKSNKRIWNPFQFFFL